MTKLVDDVPDIEAKSSSSEDKKYRLDGPICQNRILLVVFSYYTKANLHISNLTQIKHGTRSGDFMLLFYLYSLKYPFICSVMPLVEVITTIFLCDPESGFSHQDIASWYR